MHVRLIDNRRTTPTVRRSVVVTEQPRQPSSKPPPPPPPPPPSPPPPLCRSRMLPVGSNSVDAVDREGIVRIMEKVQGGGGSTARTRRLPPLSARTQRLVLGRPGQPVHRVANIPGGGHLLNKGNASVRVRSARVNTCSPTYDMMVTGE